MSHTFTVGVEGAVLLKLMCPYIMSTVIVAVAVSEHPAADVPFTVYVIVPVGVVTGDEHVVQDKPVAGAHT